MVWYILSAHALARLTRIPDSYFLEDYSMSTGMMEAEHVF
jgi:hypothetical protein